MGLPRGRTHPARGRDAGVLRREHRHVLPCVANQTAATATTPPSPTPRRLSHGEAVGGPDLPPFLWRVKRRAKSEWRPRLLASGIGADGGLGCQSIGSLSCSGWCTGTAGCRRRCPQPNPSRATFSVEAGEDTALSSRHRCSSAPHAIPGFRQLPGGLPPPKPPNQNL